MILLRHMRPTHLIAAMLKFQIQNEPPEMTDPLMREIQRRGLVARLLDEAARRSE